MLTSTGDCVKGCGILEIGQTLQRLLVFKEVSVAIAIAWHVHNIIIYYMIIYLPRSMLQRPPLLVNNWMAQKWRSGTCTDPGIVHALAERSVSHHSGACQKKKEEEGQQ